MSRKLPSWKKLLKTEPGNRVMSDEEKIPHLPAGRIFYESLAYVGDNPLAVLMFSVINYMFLVAGVSVWATGLF